MLVAGLSCPPREPGPRPLDSVAGADELVVFITGSELGALKPCGCSGGQLGGLEKRTAVFSRVPAANRVVIDAGNLVAGDGQQDLIKFGVLFEAYRLIGYDVVHLSDQDVAIAQSLGLPQDPCTPFATINSNWQTPGGSWPRLFAKRFQVGGRDVDVRVIAVDQWQPPSEQVETLLADGGDYALDIVIVQSFDASEIERWSRIPGVDCVIFPADSDEPQVLDTADAGALAVTVGRYGRHIGRLNVRFADPSQPPALRFEDIPVEEALPSDQALIDLYKRYQQLLGSANLLEAYPRIPLPDRLRYIGSENCQWCHSYEYAMWSTKAHAGAWETLVEVGSDVDPECVVCHVVGMEYEGGFINEAKTPMFQNVGCEVCHGPGSAHAQTDGRLSTVEPKLTCLDCHTPEHSSGYAGHEDEYEEKIVHWWEPEAADDVQN